MKTHSTNYQNTFIAIAEDCPTELGIEPPIKGDKLSIANKQFELLKTNPYKFTSDEVFFQIYAEKNHLTVSELESEKVKFFSKGQPCFRASPLPKKYGWGIHSDSEGKVAFYGAETKEYRDLMTDKSLHQVKAMRSKRAK